MAYCAVTDVLNKAIIKPATDAGWDVTSTSPDVGEFITEAQSVIDGILGKLGYALPFAAVPPVVKEMAKAYARYALLRDLFTGDAPSQAASILPGEFLLVEVESRRGLAAEDPVAAPGGIGSGSGLVSGAPRASGGRIPGQDQANDVVRVAGVVALLRVRRDDVVGGRHHLRQVGDELRIVTEGPKRDDLGHRHTFGKELEPRTSGTAANLRGRLRHVKGKAGGLGLLPGLAADLSPLRTPGRCGRYTLAHGARLAMF